MPKNRNHFKSKNNHESQILKKVNSDFCNLFGREYVVQLQLGVFEIFYCVFAWFVVSAHKTKKQRWPKNCLPREQRQGGKDEACIGILNNFYKDGIKWHDVECRHTKPVICQDSDELLDFVFGPEERKWDAVSACSYFYFWCQLPYTCHGHFTANAVSIAIAFDKLWILD